MEDVFVNIENYTYIKDLGQGFFGKVCLVRSNIDHQKYAMKIENYKVFILFTI